MSLKSNKPTSNKIKTEYVSVLIIGNSTQNKNKTTESISLTNI